MGRYKSPYTLYKRNKYWYYRTYSPDGIRTAGTSTGQTSKSAAKQFCDKLFLTGQLYSINVRFGEFSNHFYDEDGLYCSSKNNKLSPNTINMYQHHLQHNIMPFFQNMKLSEINYTQILAFKKYLQEHNQNPNSIQLTMNVLKPIIKTAYKDQLISRNPFDFIDNNFKSDDDVRDAFTLEEIIYLYEHIAPQYQKAILFCALVGLRISEFVGLEPEDIKQHISGFYYVDVNKQFYNGKICAPKRNSKRQVPIIKEIKDYYININTYDKSVIYEEIIRIKPNFTDADERKLSFHSLRHFFVTSAKAFNISEVKVEVLAGHALAGVKKVYTNFKVEDLTDILSWQEVMNKKIKRLPDE